MRAGVLVRAWFLVVALFAFSVPAANASPIIDQSCCAGDGTGMGLVGMRLTTRVQTFTVGQAGQMVGIDVGLLYLGTYAFELHAGAIPDGTLVSDLTSPLATLSLTETPFGVPGPFSAVARYFHASLGDGISVLPGQQFSIVGRSTQPNSSWAFLPGNPYAGGDATTTGFAGNQLGLSGGDYIFRTYVDSTSGTAVPEPATLTLFGLGLMGVRRLRRARCEPPAPVVTSLPASPRTGSSPSCHRS